MPAPITPPLPSAQSALFAALKSKKLLAVQSALSLGASPNLPDKHDWLPFNFALQGKPLKVSILRALLDAGMDPNLHTTGFSPLGLAALAGSASCILLLLRAGADLELNPGGKGTAVCIAAGAGQLDALQALLKAGAYPNPPPVGARPGALLAALQSNETECALALLAAGAHPDSTSSPRGFGPLALAVSRGHEELANALLAAGADPNAQEMSDPWFCPLAATIITGNHAMANKLFEAGAHLPISPELTQALEARAKQLGTQGPIAPLEIGRVRWEAQRLSDEMSGAAALPASRRPHL